MTTSPPRALKTPSETPATAPATKAGRGLRVVLFISLAFNLLVVGLVVGALLKGGPLREDKRPARGGDSGFGPIVQALSGEDRRALGLKMREVLRQNRMTRAQARAGILALADSVAADPFDAKALETIVAGQRTQAMLRVDIAQDLVLQRVQSMDTAERAAFAERLRAVAEGNGLRGPRAGGLHDNRPRANGSRPNALRDGATRPSQ